MPRHPADIGPRPIVLLAGSDTVRAIQVHIVSEFAERTQMRFASFDGIGSGQGGLGEFWNGLLLRLAERSRAKNPRDMPSHTNIHTVNPILKRF